MSTAPIASFDPTAPLVPTLATDHPENHTMNVPRMTTGFAPVGPVAAVAPREPDGPPSAERPPGSAARCADGNGTMTGLFFSDDVVDIARAKAMCARCPLRESCLAGALEREEPWGVWGGELLSGGRVVADKRPCGRPPKHPRPTIVYDEMGPVGVVA